MSERLRLDHLVYAVPDLASAIGSFESRLGVAPTFGGRHIGLGTHNAILPFRDETYLELIAADPESDIQGRPRPFGLDALEAPRLVTWAVRSLAIDADVERARARGFDPGKVFAMSREEPDGTVLRWKLTLNPEPRGDGLVPFVIDWGSARHPTHVVTGGDAVCELRSFSAHHPEPESICSDLVALGCELAVELDATPGLRALLTGPNGSMPLSELDRCDRTPRRAATALT